MNILNNKNIYVSLAIALFAVIIYQIIKKIISKIIENGKNNQASKKKLTYIKLISSIVKYIIIIITAMIILEINGINIISIVAGLGIASIIAGLALQDALKDIIMGFNLIIDNYFSVGDVIKINDITGKVLELGLKATKIKDIYTESIYIIANRNIGQVLNISNLLDVDIPLPYEKSIDEIETVMLKIVNKIKNLDNVSNVSYKGLNKFGDSAIYYKIRLNVKPELQPQIKRDINRLIKIELDSQNIDIPYTQIDIHSK